MHEEVQQWDIRPRFPIRAALAVLIGLTIGLAIGYVLQNIILGAVLSLMAACISGLILNRINQQRKKK